jgi:hypothetical protein
MSLWLGMGSRLMTMISNSVSTMPVMGNCRLTMMMNSMRWSMMMLTP